MISAAKFGLLWGLLLPGMVVIGLINAPSRWAPLLVVAGIAVWTFSEYALHRWVFHFEPSSKLLQQIIFIIHGNHHANSNDPLRNLMPPIVSLPVGAAIWALTVWLLGPAGTWFSVGFVAGYVAYDLVHYACHQFPMNGRLTAVLKTHHMRHHHLRARGNYAITGMVWDRLFATRIIPGNTTKPRV